MQAEPIEAVVESVSVEAEAGEEGEEGDLESASGDGKSKHSLTCQTCSKIFEHMNPRLRDCLECYRAKRKERRRGGSGERHKNVIQHPLAQQVTSKAAQQSDRASQFSAPVAAASPAVAPVVAQSPAAVSAAPMQSFINVAPPRTAVRNYRKAIEETRQITGSLKRRLERPDLPEGERRWLEQIYAYQLILHQGWRHLAQYRAATPSQGGKSAHQSADE